MYDGQPKSALIYHYYFILFLTYYYHIILSIILFLNQKAANFFSKIVLLQMKVKSLIKVKVKVILQK